MFGYSSTVNSSSAVFVPTGYSVQFRIDSIVDGLQTSEELSAEERSKLEVSLRVHRVSLQLLGQ